MSFTSSCSDLGDRRISRKLVSANQILHLASSVQDDTWRVWSVKNGVNWAALAPTRASPATQMSEDRSQMSARSRRHSLLSSDLRPLTSSPEPPRIPA